MNFLERMEFWGDRHHPKWLDIVRIALGIFLFIKGIEFLNNMGTMMSLMSSQISFNSFMVVLVSHYVVFAHLTGGLFLTFGVLTRMACLIQIPVLIGAVFFLNITGEMFRPFSELLISILLLLLLIYFLIIGNGPWSFDYLFDEKQPENTKITSDHTNN